MERFSSIYSDLSPTTYSINWPFTVRSAVPFRKLYLPGWKVTKRHCVYEVFWISRWVWERLRVIRIVATMHRRCCRRCALSECPSSVPPRDDKRIRCQSIVFYSCRPSRRCCSRLSPVVKPSHIHQLHLHRANVCITDTYTGRMRVHGLSHLVNCSLHGRGAPIQLLFEA